MEESRRWEERIGKLEAAKREEHRKGSGGRREDEGIQGGEEVGGMESRKKITMIGKIEAEKYRKWW